MPQVQLRDAPHREPVLRERGSARPFLQYQPAAGGVRVVGRSVAGKVCDAAALQPFEHASRVRVLHFFRRDVAPGLLEQEILLQGDAWKT